MSIFEICLLAIALGIDCLIVSFSQGLIFKDKRLKNSLLLASIMGFFQGFMPSIGYFGTGYITEYVAPFSQLITFLIFFLLGIHFILEANKVLDNEKKICLGFSCLINLGIATSIDAMIAGVSINLTNTNILPAGIIIGITAFIMAIIGFWIGNLFNIFSKKQLQICGGLILIFLALKSLLF